MIKKQDVFLFYLFITMPFFVKGISSGIKNNARYAEIPKTCKTSIDLSKYWVEPLKSDHNNYDKAIKMYDIKDLIVQQFGKKIENPFVKINSVEQNGVEYIRADGSGFVRINGSRTWRNMNPGALRTSPFAMKMGACGSAGGFAVFPSEEIGIQALKALLQTESYSKLTIVAAIHKYAPTCDDNDPVRYHNHLSAITGINVNRKLADLNVEELDKVAETIKILEGWKPGDSHEFGFIVNVLKQISESKQYNS